MSRLDEHLSKQLIDDNRQRSAQVRLSRELAALRRSHRIVRRARAAEVRHSRRAAELAQSAFST